MFKFKETPIKFVLRKLYGITLGFLALGNAIAPKKKKLSVHYAGALAGDVGGTLVKIQRLNAIFPESRWRYNQLYTLSNCAYLPKWSLRFLKFRGIPIVSNQNGVFYSGWYEGSWKRRNKTMSAAYHLADFVFWQSSFCRDAADKFLGKRLGDGEILFNAVDLNRFHPAVKRISDKDRMPFSFLITGKFAQNLYYRIESSIAGVAKARKDGLNIVLRVAGWVEHPSIVGKLAEKYGVESSVIYLGPYKQENAPKIYQSADAYIITKYMDPCPNVVVEAMACGLPILYSNSGGIPELVGEGAGVGLNVPTDWDKIYVPSEGQISQGMFTIMENRKSMEIEARRKAEKDFDIEAWIERHRTIFSIIRKDYQQ